MKIDLLAQQAYVVNPSLTFLMLFLPNILPDIVPNHLFLFVSDMCVRSIYL